ncbi:uncharacterized protein LOC121975408 isoform X2 [Zingiber officinale]|uniref:uncharacterized protein LOC121975408 isoform X2 n=1 Tax=Zingiber officinale TaxID=94328 RepID=UPI001C4C8627|nr:uncharacterized protein LOC121975408 isoform X2 [Zingiber officinale]
MANASISSCNSMTGRRVSEGGYQETAAAAAAPAVYGLSETGSRGGRGERWSRGGLHIHNLALFSLAVCGFGGGGENTNAGKGAAHAAAIVNLCGFDHNISHRLQL